MIYVILLLIVIIIFMAFIISFYVKDNKETDEKLKQLAEKHETIQAQEEKEHEIDQHTVEQVESITTGNNNNDFAAGVDLLHDLSGKRKITK